MAPSAQELWFYHRTDALLEGFLRLADPSRCGLRLSIDNLHDPDDPTFKLRVATFEDVNARDDGASFRTNAHVLLNFGAHGRELISSEVALRLARMLCGEAPSRFAGSEERSREAISAILRRVVIKVVPVQVPASRRLAETGEGTCKQRRVNSRGVDVNRNWDIAWDKGDGGQGSSQYRGPRAFSEPETRALARFAGEWRPDAFVDVRSGDRYMAMPFASIDSSPPDRADREAMRGVARGVNKMFKQQYPPLVSLGDVPFGPASSLGEEPFRASGTALDYMYSKLGVRRSYMFEVYGISTVYGGRKLGKGGPKSIGKQPTSASFLQTEARANYSAGHAADSTVSSATSSRQSRTAIAPDAPDHNGQRKMRRGSASELEPKQLVPPASIYLSTAEGEVQRGMPALLPNDEEVPDCVGFFNPTSQAEYETTVNGWADALLIVINSTLAASRR
jgi:hypothetical protein